MDISENGRQIAEIQEGGLYFYPELRKACVGDTEIELTVKEYDALHLLISNQNRILTYETLARQIWGEEYIDITSKTIHNLISRVRHKLQVSPDSHSYIVCVRGVGYKFDAGTQKTKLGQIGEKLFTLLNEQQKRALAQCVSASHYQPQTDHDV